MIDETMFGIALAAVLLGWLLLIAGVLAAEASPARQRLMDMGGLWLPVVLAAALALLLAASLVRSGSPGSLFSLAGIVTLFGNIDRLFLLYLEGMAFSLFIGRWIALDAIGRGMRAAMLVPILFVQSLLGPAGLAAWFALRGFVRRRSVAR